MSRPCSRCNHWSKLMFPCIDENGCTKIICETCLADIANKETDSCDWCGRPVLVDDKRRYLYHGKEICLCADCRRRILMEKK